MNKISFIRGVNDKPAASKFLEEALASIEGLSGECFFGYPLISTPDGKYSIDATLVSPEKGVIIFDLVEGTDVGEYKTRQDDFANIIEAKLRLHKGLLQKRHLIPPLTIVTFAPILNENEVKKLFSNDYRIANKSTLGEVLLDLPYSIPWGDGGNDLYRKTLSAIENLSSIRTSRSKRELENPDSRGTKLKKLEESIATLDHMQNRAVIETVNGVQRIRGLAGSGKTIVLALKAAYLHTQYPNWRIAITFNTRSLKGQFKRLVNNFCVEQSGEEPDWTKIRIVNAWGAPGDDERDGIYYEFCRATGQEFYDFNSAKSRFGNTDNVFGKVCQAALDLATATRLELYDAILVDEAQDFDPSFLRLCYAMLKQPKRLVYAYDELQNLSGRLLPPPEEIFGVDEQGQPLVRLSNNLRQDVILKKCYRNSRPVLVTAHALGFGIYRKPPEDIDTGLVQIFDKPDLWEEIGYTVQQGRLANGEHVILERTDETSPMFLENHSELDDLVVFKKFDNETEQNSWLVEQIEKNIKEDELRCDDIIVIHPEPKTARERLGPIRMELFKKGIQNHLAGVDTDPDIFFKTETSSITFSSIYRAKGNEAGMVYVINAQDCDGTTVGLAELRNRLFTAITRSKAWVRVIGYGQGMSNLIDEFECLKRHDFKLDFIYPTNDVLKKLKIVYRDLSPNKKKEVKQNQIGFSKFIENLVRGEATLDGLDTETKQKLIKVFKKYKE